MSLDLALVTRLRRGLAWLPAGRSGEDGSVRGLIKMAVKPLTYPVPAYMYTLHMHTLEAVWRTRLSQTIRATLLPQLIPRLWDRRIGHRLSA